ncbi:hypothetical protein B0A55_02013 [Friedmanniomyces simplex]|uniref:Uncharacterized protein n=1 Tax=Friedmanniomyces simplex TaxID=329884 RepID=A0A4U0XS97_9PEZI|nr:hypothetical protein B0A55_02013 [Friedmanniomyces simplex]
MELFTTSNNGYSVSRSIQELLSVKAAFAGSYAIFGVTTFFAVFPKVGKDKAIDIETKMGVNLAIAAAATPKLQDEISSTLPNSCRISDGEIIVSHYDGKN